MTLNLSCLNIYENISLIGPKTGIFLHPTYKGNGESFLSRFSSRITGSLFSSNDLKFFLINSFKFPTKFISSIIISSSLLILFFVTCSIIFYIISYSNINKLKSKEIRLKIFYLILFILINLFLLIQMILIIENLNKTKINFDQSIEQLNNQFNSEKLSKYFKYLLNKFDKFSSNSLIIDQTKLLMIKRSSSLLNNYYFLDEINLFLNKINKSFYEIIKKNKKMKNSFIQFKISYENILKDLFNLNKNICFYFDRNYFDIEQKILYLLNLIYEQFQNLIRLIDQHVLKKFNFNFLHKNKIRSTILLITNLTIINITFITIIPMAFFIFITINYFCFYFNHQDNM